MAQGDKLHLHLFLSALTLRYVRVTACKCTPCARHVRLTYSTIFSLSEFYEVEISSTKNKSIETTLKHNLLQTSFIFVVSGFGLISTSATYSTTTCYDDDYDDYYN